MKARIEAVAQAIPQQVQAQGCYGDRGPRKEREVGSDPEKVAALGHHGSPLSQRRLSTETEKAEPGGRQHYIAGSQSGLDQNWNRRISQNVMVEDAPRPCSQSAGSLNVFHAFE